MYLFVVGLGKGKSTVAYSRQGLSEVCSERMPLHTNWWLPSPENRKNFSSRQGWVFPLPPEFSACWECLCVKYYSSKYTACRTARK